MKNELDDDLPLWFYPMAIWFFILILLLMGCAYCLARRMIAEMDAEEALRFEQADLDKEK